MFMHISLWNNPKRCYTYTKWNNKFLKSKNTTILDGYAVIHSQLYYQYYIFEEFKDYRKIMKKDFMGTTICIDISLSKRVTHFCMVEGLNIVWDIPLSTIYAVPMKHLLNNFYVLFYANSCWILVSTET